MKPKILLNLSGGADSVSCLWKILQQYDSRQVMVHHCRLLNTEGRERYEYQAVQDVLDWMNKQSLSGYHYKETSMDFRDTIYALWDLTLVGFWEGYFARGYRSLEKMVGTGAMAGRPEQYMASWRRNTRDRTTIAQTYARRPLKWIKPNHHLTKQQMIRELPRDLLDLTWFCRTPTEEGGACGRCGTCRRYASSGVPWRGAKVR